MFEPTNERRHVVPALGPRGLRAGVGGAGAGELDVAVTDDRDNVRPQRCVDVDGVWLQIEHHLETVIADRGEKCRHVLQVDLRRRDDLRRVRQATDHHEFHSARTTHLVGRQSAAVQEAGEVRPRRRLLEELVDRNRFDDAVAVGVGPNCLQDVRCARFVWQQRERCGLHSELIGDRGLRSRHSLARHRIGGAVWFRGSARHRCNQQNGDADPDNGSPACVSVHADPFPTLVAVVAVTVVIRRVVSHGWACPSLVPEGDRWSVWCSLSLRRLVYRWCMSRTNIDIDDELCQRVMERFHLSTKREAVNLALRHVAGEPLGLDEARSMRGSGWDGDLDEMRTSRV